MSIFNELLCKISDLSNKYTKKFNEDLEEAIQCLDKFEEEILNNKRTREKLQKKNATTTLQSIHEDDDDTTQALKENKNESNAKEKSQRGSKKRSKGEVDDMFSPEQDKRQKRSASVKAQSVISKQVNVNLNQKLRREDENAKTKGNKAKDDNKENTEPSLIQIKQEKISLPPEPEPMDMESLNVDIKQEVNRDEITMPPPMAPVPKPRKGAPKEKPAENTEEETGRSRRTTRTRKQTDTVEQPIRQSSRSTRASSRASSRTEKATDSEEPAPAETRPKRTRTKRAVADSSTANNDKETQPESVTASPAEKPRPKRTRKGQKAAEKPVEKPVEPEPELEPIISPKMEKLSEPPVSMSPLLPAKKTNKIKENGKVNASNTNVETVSETLDATKIISQNMNTTVTISNNLDATMVLPNGVYNHVPVTPKAVQMNETMVLETNNETIVIEKQPEKAIMDATVVIEKDTKAPNVTDDNSLLTDDNDSVHAGTPPKQPPKPQPISAVKEKVQQFEEMATRQTRTKTRAMAKKEEQTENQTPPDKVSKAILTAEQLSLMNNMIFNSKQPQISSSTSKLNAYTKPVKNNVTASASKVSYNRTKDSVEEQRREKEDARRKKEALLEAKREMQKKKREEKMAAAAAARLAAERERRAAQEAAARGKLEKMAHVDAGKLERLKEVEKKKLELARKVAETEERRRADEAARAQRAAELRRAEETRQKQLHEAEALKKEAALMDKEIERRQREFMEKQKLKQKMENKCKMLTPLKTPGTPNGMLPPVEPVYMADGFEYLNSDEEQEPAERPIPAWSTPKVWRARLAVQSRVATEVVDRLFSVRAHTPDLREIFPGIERARLKRTSSAVWRTPPQRLPALAE
ncbi:inner centromere protein isoform X1 [Aricia agestis]|uniref:inner centromere protein isoform X1 n=1 Tax=Aricia agestis TaxID=91739 RepID=UPI001C208579|nr:inner centromere protein isoform X1 [Aricia agestis]